LAVRRRVTPISGRLAVVGGQCRKVGKSSLVADLIRALPEARWTAVKITPYAENGCPLNGTNCSCAPFEHTFSIREEQSRTGRSDTARYLGAGAEQAIWVQTKEGRLSEALGELASRLAGAESVIIESDAIVSYWQPDLFLMVLDPRKADFKSSAWRILPYADAFVFRSPYGGGRERGGCDITRNGKRKFLHPIGYDLPASMQTFVRQRFRALRHPIARQARSLFS
jgi:hypothetical protein